MKKLIIYYSLDGNTKFIADKMAEMIEADILELNTTKEISKKEPFKHICGLKQVLFKKNITLKSYNFNPDYYNTLIIGTPVWAFTFAPAIAAFLKENNIKEKKIILFCTYGSGEGRTFTHFKKNLSGNEIVGEEGFKNVLKNTEANIEKLKDFLEKIDKKNLI